jgi:hypothetical protein
MAKKFDFDWKNFLLQYGERIGLGVALGVLLLILVLGLFWPGTGVFSGSPAARAKELKDKTQTASNLLKTRAPSEEEAKQMASVPPELYVAGTLSIENPDKFRGAEFFQGVPVDDNRRREPRILPPVEYAVATFQLPIASYILVDNGDRIMVLRGADVKAGSGGPGGMGAPGMRGGSNMQQFTSNLRSTTSNRGQNVFNNQMMRGMTGGPGAGPPGGAGMPGAPGGGMGSRMGPGAGGGNPRSFMQGAMSVGGPSQGSAFGNQDMAKERKRQQLVTLEEFEKMDDARPAQRATPTRGVLFMGSIPFRKQIEEFQRALHVPTTQAALQEMSFSGFNVQRRVVIPGAPREDWNEAAHTIPMEGFYRALVALAGKEFEEPTDNQRKYAGVQVEGLMMPLPKLLKGHSYPDPVDKAENMQKLKDAMKQLEDKHQPLVVLKNTRFSTKDKDFNPYALQQDSGGQAAQGASDGGGKPPAGGTVGGGGAGSKLGGPASPDGGNAKASGTPAAEGGYQVGQNYEAPEYVLFRFLDVTPMVPGTTYEYRIQIRMANPNHGHDKDLAYPDLAKPKEIVSAWFEVPGAVTVPNDFYLYAEDMRKDKDEARAYVNHMPAEKGQTLAFQLQRWVETVAPPEGNSKPTNAGEWAVLDRVLLHNGEYVGGTYKVELPVWDFFEENYIMAAFNTGRFVGSRRIDVQFSGDPPPLLVHFEGGEVTDASKKVRDTAPTEVLMLSPEGRLFVHEADAGVDDPDRRARLKEWRDRVGYVRRLGKKGALKDDGTGGGGAFDPKKDKQ